MSSVDDIINYQDRLTIHRRNLNLYLQQYAKVGGTLHATPNIIHGIDEARRNIRQIKEVLKSWDVKVNDHPDDEDLTSSSLAKQATTESRSVSDQGLADTTVINQKASKNSILIGQAKDVTINKG